MQKPFFVMCLLTTMPCTAMAGEAHKLSPDIATITTSSADDCEAAMNEAGIRDLVRAEAAKQGVDEKLALAITLQELRFGVDLNSPKGARGPMQLMPATAAMYGVTDICNAVQNVRGGVSYLKDLGAAFQGNMMLVAAAYNAGPERVYQAQGVPAIPETVRYVASVTNSYYGLKTLSARTANSRPPQRGRRKRRGRLRVISHNTSSQQASKTGLAGRFFMLSRVKEKRSNETQ